MPEKAKIQHIPVKVYRSADHLSVAAPLPGLQAEDILIKVTDAGHLVIEGELRGKLKDIKELLIDEWSIGGYHRDLELPNPVDGQKANVTYGNGVIVISLPISDKTVAAALQLEKNAIDHGERVGWSGHK